MATRDLNLGLILQGCKQGNSNSQERLYRHFYPYALSICLRYAKNREEAVEILNDGFLKIFSRLDQYDPSFPFKTWIRRIMINTAIDYHRKYHKNPPFLELNTNLPGNPKGQETEIEIDSSVSTLLIVQQLSPAYRMVFNLYVMEGYKHQEIAEKLGVSVSTSKTNLARAKARLKKMILNGKHLSKSKIDRHG